MRGTLARRHIGGIRPTPAPTTPFFTRVGGAAILGAACLAAPPWTFSSSCADPNGVSDTVKKMTALTAILTVNSPIAGIYEMNFDVMPELHVRYGHPLAGESHGHCVNCHVDFVQVDPLVVSADRRRTQPASSSGGGISSQSTIVRRSTRLLAVSAT